MPIESGTSYKDREGRARLTAISGGREARKPQPRRGVFGLVAICTGAIAVGGVFADSYIEPSPGGSSGNPSDVNSGPTAQDIRCSKDTRTIVAGSEPDTTTLFDIAHSPKLIPGANINEAQSMEEIKGLNPDDNLQIIYKGQAISIPLDCVKVK